MDNSGNYSEIDMQESIGRGQEFEISSRGKQEEEEGEEEYVEEELVDIYQSAEEQHNEEDDQQDDDEGEEEHEEEDDEIHEEHARMEVAKDEKIVQEAKKSYHKKSVLVIISEDEAEEMEVNGIPFFRDPITGIITIERQISGKMSTEELEEREDAQFKDEGQHLYQLEVIGEQEDQHGSRNGRDSEDNNSNTSNNKDIKVMKEGEQDTENDKEHQEELAQPLIFSYKPPGVQKIEENQTETPNDLNSQGELDKRASRDLNEVNSRNKTKEEEQNIQSNIQVIEEVGQTYTNKVEIKEEQMHSMSDNMNRNKRNNENNLASSGDKQQQKETQKFNFAAKKNENLTIKQQQSSKQHQQQQHNFQKPSSHQQPHHKYQQNQQQYFKSINIYRDRQKPSMNSSPTKLQQQQDNLIHMYENAMNHQREKQQRNQQIREQKEAQALSHCTFSPAITKKAQMLSQKQQNYMDIASKTQIFMQKKQLIAELAEQTAAVEESRHCTFKPQVLNYQGDQANASRDGASPLSIYERQIQWQKSVEEKNQQRLIETSQQLLCFTPQTNGNRKQPSQQKVLFESDKRSPLLKQQQKQLQLSNSLSNGQGSSSYNGSPSFASYLAEKYQWFLRSKEKGQQQNKHQTKDYSQSEQQQNNSQQKSMKIAGGVEEEINRKRGNYFENTNKANHQKMNLKMENELAQLSKQLFAKDSRIVNDSEIVKIGLNRSLSGYMQSSSGFSQQNGLHSKSEKKEINVDQQRNQIKNDSNFFLQLSNFNDIIVQNNHYALSPQHHAEQQSEQDFQLAKHVIAQNAMNSAFSATQSQTNSNHNSKILKNTNNNNLKQQQQY